MTHVVRSTAGLSFESGADRARIVVSGRDTDGRYSLLEWTVAAAEGALSGERDFGPHVHRHCEETFLIRTGSLEFLIGDEVVTLNPGDFVRVPPGTRHGYQNVSGKPVDMLVSFTPGGFEDLFVKYRTDQQTVSGAGFVADATRDYASEFDLPYP